MTIDKFDEFLEQVLMEVKRVLSSKSEDYSTHLDKLYNFKLAARIAGVSYEEALRGMQLKHQASIAQGLDELKEGKVRELSWWEEKIIDNINYNILLLALRKEINE